MTKANFLTKGPVDERAFVVLQAMENGYRMVTLKGITRLTSPDGEWFCYVPLDVLEYLVEHDLADQNPMQ